LAAHFPPTGHSLISVKLYRGIHRRWNCGGILASCCSIVAQTPIQLGRPIRSRFARPLQQMLHEWAMHDLGHIRQIAELVRARKHWKAAGKLGESYQLRP